MKQFAVIFDMDGVLVDSTEIIWASHNEVLGRYGVHLTDADIRQYQGKSLRDGIEGWNKKYGLSLDLKTHTEASWPIQLRMIEKMHPDPGLLTLLDDLKSYDVKMGVGTSSQKFRAEKILELLKLRDYFTVLVTANDVQRHKPNPDVYLEVANKLDIAPERCVVFEDAYNGIEAAKRGNMKTIGYSKYADEMKNADLIINSFSDISYERISRLFDNVR
jgi:HAD superfamily hydrolase (TIGR01509 family)